MKGSLQKKKLGTPEGEATCNFPKFYQKQRETVKKKLCLKCISSCVKSFYPTCQGYSFTSVSCPPMILERLLAWPQVQVLVLPPEMVVAGGGVVVTWEGVVVEANINNIITLFIDTFTIS